MLEEEERFCLFFEDECAPFLFLFFFLNECRPYPQIGIISDGFQAREAICEICV